MNQLRWMRAPEESLAQWDEHVALAAAVRADGLTRTLVCGMGGSSLVADVLAETFGARSLHVLDSTNPEAVRAAVSPADLAHTLFVVSSKSGNTVETLAFCHYFMARARPEQFVAITESGTPLEALARERRFRAIIPHPPDVGGRYSALTAVGMVPAALGNIDGRRLLERTGHTDIAAAKKLGVTIAAKAKSGADKLRVTPPPQLAALARWIEQIDRCDRVFLRSTGSRRRIPPLGIRYPSIGRAARREPIRSARCRGSETAGPRRTDWWRGAACRAPTHADAGAAQKAVSAGGLRRHSRLRPAHAGDPRAAAGPARCLGRETWLRLDTRYWPALPPLHRPTAQGRTQHRPVSCDHDGYRRGSRDPIDGLDIRPVASRPGARRRPGPARARPARRARASDAPRGAGWARLETEPVVELDQQDVRRPVEEQLSLEVASYVEASVVRNVARATLRPHDE
ncbi:MAG: hypothetical protein DMD58_15275, partial [Gemmatimonadetes bacterium]